MSQRITREEAARRIFSGEWDHMTALEVRMNFTIDDRVERLETALRDVAEKQRAALQVFVRHGIKFEDIGHDPTNWQHIAFSLYTDLCELAGVAERALDGEG
jgi:hypothetical protein